MITNKTFIMNNKKISEKIENETKLMSNDEIIKRIQKLVAELNNLDKKLQKLKLEEEKMDNEEKKINKLVKIKDRYIEDDFEMSINCQLKHFRNYLQTNENKEKHQNIIFEIHFLQQKLKTLSENDNVCYL